MTLHYAHNIPHGQSPANPTQYHEPKCCLLYLRIKLVTVLLQYVANILHIPLSSEKNSCLRQSLQWKQSIWKDFHTYTYTARAFIWKQMPIYIITKFSVVRVKLVTGPALYYMIKCELFVRNYMSLEWEWLYNLGNVFECSWCSCFCMYTCICINKWIICII